MNVLAPIGLAPLSGLYRAITRARLGLYRRELLPVSQLTAPVISVGNITTGGTGKTPLVELIARKIARSGRRVCVLTRGFGRANATQRVVVSDGQRILAEVNEAGDEPLLLAENLQGSAAVISDADRYEAGLWAIQNLGSEIFILDDGFQHLRLARNMNIVAIDATQPLARGRVLPWGRLREPAKNLSRADCVVITRTDQPDSRKEVREEIGRLMPGKPVFTSGMTTRGFKRLGKGTSADQGGADQASLIPQPVAAFCGIGNPSSFTTQLKNAGYAPVNATVFRDHHRYTQHDLKEIVSKAKDAGARSLITTAKDGVKLRSLNIELPCYVLEIEITIDDEAGFLETVLLQVNNC